MRKKFYGDSTKINRSKPRPNIYGFSLEDIDNEDVISAVESLATYKRSRETLDEIRKIAKGATTKQGDTGEEKTDGNPAVIKFA